MSRCLKCIHFLKGGVNGSSRPPKDMVRTDEVGLCRRHPPVHIPAGVEDDHGFFGFPCVHQDHRCGEWSDGSEWNMPC